LTAEHDPLWVDEPGLVEPQPRGEELRWFTAAGEGRLLVTRCETCGAASLPLRAVCPACGSSAVADEHASGRGTIHTFTVQRRRSHPDVPVPNLVALVDLDEGPRMMSRIVGADPDDVHIGAAVDVRFARCGDLGVPLFVLADGHR
jgi:uncharacterized OB-fold protein